MIESDGSQCNDTTFTKSSEDDKDVLPDTSLLSESLAGSSILEEDLEEIMIESDGSQCNDTTFTKSSEDDKDVLPDTSLLSESLAESSTLAEDSEEIMIESDGSQCNDTTFTKSSEDDENVLAENVNPTAQDKIVLLSDSNFNVDQQVVFPADAQAEPTAFLTQPFKVGESEQVLSDTINSKEALGPETSSAIDAHKVQDHNEPASTQIIDI